MVPLTVRSNYSLMWGVDSIQRICHKARSMGYEQLALTDTDNIYGLWSFLSACRRTGIAPIVGAEITEPGNGRRVVCLVQNEDGYANLCRLISRRHMEDGFNIETGVGVYGEGLIVLTTDPGLLASWYDDGIRVAAAMPRRPLPSGHALYRWS